LDLGAVAQPVTTTRRMKPSSPAPARPWASGFTDGDLVASAVLFQPPGSSANRLPYFGPSLSLILGWLAVDQAKCYSWWIACYLPRLCLSSSPWPNDAIEKDDFHGVDRTSPKLIFPSRPNFGLHCRGNSRQVPARLPEGTASNLSTKRFAFLQVAVARRGSSGAPVSTGNRAEVDPSGARPRNGRDTVMGCLRSQKEKQHLFPSEQSLNQVVRQFQVCANGSFR
jgi:hypothetical protein